MMAVTRCQATRRLSVDLACLRLLRSDLDAHIILLAPNRRGPIRNGCFPNSEPRDGTFLSDHEALAEACRLVMSRIPIYRRPRAGLPVIRPARAAHVRRAWMQWRGRLVPGDGTQAPTVLGRLRQAGKLSDDAITVLAMLVVFNTHTEPYRQLQNYSAAVGLLMDLAALSFEAMDGIIGTTGELVEAGITELVEINNRSSFQIEGVIAVTPEVVRAVVGLPLRDEERWSLPETILSALHPGRPIPAATGSPESEGGSPPSPEPGDGYPSEGAYIQDRIDYLQAIVEVRKAEAEVKDPSTVGRFIGEREPDSRLRLAVSRLASFTRRIARRLDATERAGLKMPEMESMAREFGLSVAERDIVLALIAADLRPEFRNRLVGRMEEFPVVRGLVSLVATDVEGQIARLRLFASDSTLRREGIIEFDRDGLGSLSDVAIMLNRDIHARLLGYQPKEGILAEGLALQPPTHGWADVILCEPLKDLIARLVLGSEGVAPALEALGLGRYIPYGRAPGIVLTGDPGVGKTYTAEACASLLGKRILRARCDRLSPGAVSSLGREARMSGAILLLEEVDGLFGDRDLVGGVRALLTDIERAREPFIATTNRSFSFDKAFGSRVIFVRLPPPDADLRLRLWNQLLPTTLPFDRQPNRAELARRYDLTGREIKTAVVATFMSGRSSGSEPMLRERDLLAFIRSTEEAKRDGGASEAGFRLT